MRLAPMLVCFFLASLAAADDASLAPSARAPQGEYAIARLELSAGVHGQPQKLFLGLRGGKLANFWFIVNNGGDDRLHLRTSTVELKADSLAGKVELRTAPGRGRPMVSASFALSLQRDGSKLAGECSFVSENAALVRPGKASVTGTLHAAPPAADALAREAAWPSFYGPNGDMSAQPQPPLVEDLSQARPVWRSEVYVPTGYGNAPDSRYFTRALISGNGGGGSSPIVADGTVYMYFYLPSPTAAVSQQNPYWQRSYPDQAAFDKQMAELKATPEEVQRVLGHFRAAADDHVVAMDAATGATRWAALLPQRSPNLQTHKHRGISGVPLVAGGTVYVPNLASRLYAIDAASGNLKWESPAFDPAKEATMAKSGPSNPSPLLFGQTLAWARGGQVIGFDARTGTEQWKAPGGYMLRWSSGGKDRIIAFAGATLACVDPATGKVIWKQDTDLAAGAPLSAVIAGDMLLAAPAPEKGGSGLRYGGWQLSDAGAKKVWDAEPIKPDENMPVTILPGGKAMFLGAQCVRVIEAATGKTVLQRTFAQGEDGPGSNAWAGVVGGRLLFCPEGQHGSLRLQFMDPQTLKYAGPVWPPANTSTTAYNSQPVVYPIVDGRMFLRGGDGIYCYDLRKGDR